jgi:hypothetical protein
MLVDLRAELADLHKILADPHAHHHEEDAARIADRIVQLEWQILSLPAETLSDAAVKLQILRMEMDDNMTPVQQRALDDAARVVSAKCFN